MSYLDPLRLHFAGRFQANVSTVNNDPGHFQNDVFQSDYQQLQTRAAMNGWFNPEGDGGWRLMGCRVTSAWTPGGRVAADPVLACLVADSDTQVCGKLVDLDPEQQLVSQIWGLQVRICDRDGSTLLRGDFEPVAFMDIWDRATGGGHGDSGAGAMYQSVLTNLEWGDVSGSDFLTKLKASAGDGLLSIKLNVDGFNLKNTDPDFMTGRIAGTIGPAAADEPRHMLRARQLMAVASPKGNFFTPMGGINFCPAVVDERRGAIFLDLGNALSTTTPGGPFNDLGDLTLGVYDTAANPPHYPQGAILPLGSVPASLYTAPDWYAETAGVVELTLDPALLSLCADAPLMLYAGYYGSTAQYTIQEPPAGAYVRADTYVFRMSPGDEVAIPLVATRFGKPLANAELALAPDPNQLQPSNSVNPGDVPPVAIPPGALAYAARASTDAEGRAWMSVTASDPGTPRYFRDPATGETTSYGIDGQVYGLRPEFTDAALNPPSAQLNQWNFVSLLLWSGFTPASPPTWDDLQPIFQQAANLYPVMGRFLDLGDYGAVRANAHLLKLAFGLAVSDPNAMPVTRDLSPAKRRAILAWLDNPLPGTAAPKAAVAAATPGAPAGPPSAAHAALAVQGGKAAAAARRLCKQP
jgi:hypothetical protein